MRKWRKLLASLLIAALLTSIFPTQALAAESDDGETVGVIQINGEDLIVDNEIRGELPAGVQYAASSKTLTLNNASLSSIWIWSQDITIELIGSSTINFTPSDDSPTHAALKFDSCPTAVITGGGTLTATSPIETLCFERNERGNNKGTLTITGGATVIAENTTGYWKDEAKTQYGYAGMNGHVDLIVNGGATLTSTGGFEGIATIGNVTLENCTVNTNRFTLTGEDYGNGEATTYDRTVTTVGQGAVVNVTALETDEIDSFLRALNNAELVLDGGKININTTAKDAGHVEALHTQEAGSSILIKAGTLYITTLSGRGIDVDTGTSFTQTGGDILIQHADPTRDDVDWYASAGMEIHTGGQAIISGGTFTTKDLECGIQLEDTLTINSGTVTLEGRNTGLALSPMGGLVVLGGVLDVTTIAGTRHGRSALHSDGGLFRFLGGTTKLNGPRYALLAGIDSENIVTLGSNMYAVDDAGKEALLEVSSSGVTRYPAPKVTISNTPGSSTYAASMELVNGSQLTAGSAFTVRMVLSLDTANGTVTFTIPDKIQLLENSVTVNGQAVNANVNGQQVTVPVKNSDIIRFTAAASEAGDYNITAAVTSGQTHQETLSLNVSAFTLSLPSQVNRTTIPVSGTAMPRSTVTLYDGDAVVGTATANALGNWGANMEIAGTVGEHSISAAIAFKNGGTVKSETFSLHYDPNNAVVKTLTVSNMIHGKTDADPPVETKVIIDYQNGTRSSNYYTYWPDLPTFTFTVAFAGSTGTPDKVEDVTVVTTDWRGVETTVPLSYDTSTGTWIGTHDFDGDRIPVPESFRVEWEAAGTSDAEEPDEIPPVETPEPVIEDNRDGALVMGGTGLTFAVSDPASLRLTDSFGAEIAFTNSGGTISSSAYQPGEIYIATLSGGYFPDYRGHDTLYIMIEGGADWNTYEYADNVIENVDSTTFENWTDSTFTSSASYEVDNVLIVDNSRALLITGSEGNTYTYEDAGLEEIYSTLKINTIDVNAEPILEGFDEETIAQEFMQTEMFAAFRAAVEAYASDHAAGTITKDEPSFSIKVNLEYERSGTASNPHFLLKPVITVESSMKTKLPGDQERETVVSAVFSYAMEEDFSYLTWIEDETLKSMSVTREQKETVGLDISVSIAGKTDSGEENEKYFGEEALRRYLQKIDPDDKFKAEISLGKVSVPSTIPGLYLILTAELETELAFFGEVGVESSITFEQTDGFLYTQQSGLKTFGTSKDPALSADITLHVKASASKSLSVGIGVEYWKTISAVLYGKGGVGISINGHGKAHYTSAGDPSADAELLVSSSIDFSAGLRISVELAKLLNFDYEVEVWRKSIPIFTLGTNEMPTSFATIEELVYVNSSCDLKQLLDMELNYQAFSAELFSKTIFERQKVFDLNHYHFELVGGDNQKVSLTDDGHLTITRAESGDQFNVKVIYTGSTESYQIWKIVPLYYVDDSFTILKDTQPDGSKVAGFYVEDLTTGTTPVGTFMTSPNGIAIVPATQDHTYRVTELWCAPGYSPLVPTQNLTVTDLADELNTVKFINVKNQKEHTPDVGIPGLGDPSGYVYEGIENNRMSGVTVSLYQADDSSGSNSMLWAAEDYNQASVLTTDVLGQYLWMVPNGSYWKVECTSDGYDPVSSEWLPVPPVQTGVNLGLYSTKEASMTVSASEDDNFLVLRFDRPVTFSSLANLTVTVNGQEVGGELVPLDSGWSVTENPTDSKLCATTFYFEVENPLPSGASVAVSAPDAVTYAGTDSTAQDSTTVTGSGSSGGPDVPGPTEPVNPPVPGGTSTAGGSSLITYPVSTPSSTVGGTVAVSPKNAEKSGMVTITVKPDDGYELDSLTVTDKNGNTVKLTKKNDTQYIFTMPASKVTINATFVEMNKDTGVSFTDVSGSAYYRDAVAWAVANGITNGITASTFSPNAPCTRAQIVTFLWRAAGSPDPKSSENPFSDMVPGAYYYDAVLWAVEQGITNGTTDTTFSPDVTCTRAQAVTFLWRAEETPSVTSVSSFSDVSDSAYYAGAVQWAVVNGVTNGATATTFSPSATCTRAQIVTFIYRAKA